MEQARPFWHTRGDTTILFPTTIKHAAPLPFTPPLRKPMGIVLAPDAQKNRAGVLQDPVPLQDRRNPLTLRGSGRMVNRSVSSLLSAEPRLPVRETILVRHANVAIGMPMQGTPGDEGSRVLDQQAIFRAMWTRAERLPTRVEFVAQ